MSARPPIDWPGLRARLRAVAESDDGGVMPPEKRQHILETRARSLAQTLDDRDGGASASFLFFSLGDESFGLDARVVISVAPSSRCSPIPGAPAHLLGVLATRHGLLPLIDPRPLLGVPARPPSGQEPMIIIGREQAELALRCNHLDEIIELGTDAVQRLPDADEATDLVFALAPGRGAIIGADALLRDPRLFFGQGHRAR